MNHWIVAVVVVVVDDVVHRNIDYYCQCEMDLSLHIYYFHSVHAYLYYYSFSVILPVQYTVDDDAVVVFYDRVIIMEIVISFVCC